MAELKWGEPANRLYETGIDRGAFYPKNGAPAGAWPGLMSLDEGNNGSIEPSYYDGLKIRDIESFSDFSASFTTIAIPDTARFLNGELDLAPGLSVGEQPRIAFDFTYRTLIGSALLGVDAGYKLHLVYRATLLPSGQTYQTNSDSVNLNTRSFEIVTVPPKAVEYKPTAHLKIDSRAADPAALENLEFILYGDLSTEPRMPTQSEVLEMFGG